MQTITVNLSLRKELLERIDEAAKSESRTRSDLIREAARYYIEKKKSEVTYAANITTREVDEGVAERAAKYDTGERRYSYVDYLKWPDEERWELIDGIPYDMSPAPNEKHQLISMALSSMFYFYLKGKPCKVYAAPFDVRFPKRVDAPDNEIFDVVQPDILVVCDRTRVDFRGGKAAPDLVVEILSPSTCRKDVTKKLKLYERDGVREYWVIRPEEETVTVFGLGDDKKYGCPVMHTVNDKVKVGIFNGDLIIDLQEVFMY